MKVFYSISTLALLNSLLAPAAMAQTQPTGVGQIGSANVKMAEIRNVLVNNAYRIDKEMVAKSASSTDFYVSLKYGPETGKSKGKIFTKDAIGNLLSQDVGYYSRTDSETYQIHKKADTWAIITLDKSGYLKHRAAIEQSDLMQKNICARNGKAFLDTLVADYKILSAEQLETLAKDIGDLNDAKIKSAMAADASGKEDVLGNKIDEFLDQRTRVVRIHWQELLNRTGDCADDFAENFAANTNGLYQNLKKSSVFLNGSSLANIPAITFSEMPYKSDASQVNAAARISAVGARLLVHKVQTLKMMKDLGYIEFQRGDDMNFSQSKGEISRAILKKGPELVQLYKAANDREQNVISVAQGIFSIGQTSFVVGSGILIGQVVANVSLADVPESAERSMMKGFVGNFALSATAGVLYYSVAPKVGKIGMAKQSELKQEIYQDILKDQDFVNATNNQIMLAETIYSLSENENYMKQRPQLIAGFRDYLVSELLYQILSNRGKMNFTNVTYSYSEYLTAKKLISKEAYFEMEQIVGVMTRSQIIANSVNRIVVQKNQIQTLLTSVQAIKAENKDSSKQQDLERLEKNLKNELEILKLLK